MSEKITYAEFNTKMREHQQGLITGKHLIPRPNLRDVDMSTVPSGKRGLVAAILENEPKKGF